jgi:glucose-6-phosphate 1-dehydrogenase
MKNITFLVLGITGDLAKRKVLPSISEFSDNNPQFHTHLLGYSRSEVDMQKIISILNETAQHETHTLTSINYEIGQYNDMTKLDSIFSSISKEDHLIIYLALPPSVFIQFLEAACPLDPSNIDIIIEKPFGQNLQEAKHIIEVGRTCTLTNRIHFFDHYSFKHGLDISPEIQTTLQAFLTNKTVTALEINAFEEIGVDNRLGFYDKIGATKDMIQHLITLTNSCNEALSFPLLVHESLVIKTYQFGQYKGYPLEQSTTETYSEIKMKHAETDLTFKTGKNLDQKCTELTYIFNIGDTLKWIIDPNPHIILKENGVETSIQIRFEKSLMEHTKLFQTLISGNTDKLISNQHAIEAWLIYDAIHHFTMTHPQPMVIYKAHKYPLLQVGQKNLLA